MTQVPPPPQGLYDPRFEHDSCGVSFVVDMYGRKSHEMVQRGQVVVDAIGDFPGVGRPRCRGGGQAFSCQLDQVRIGVAVLQSLKELDLVGMCGHGERDLTLTWIGRLAGQDLGQEPAQGKDVGALVELIHAALRLLGRHVGRCAQD